MTGKRCTDCKHTRGIGFDFWCGEGHTEYEVLGAETNCPYYEYHDWSKGIPNETKNKRFELEILNTDEYVIAEFDSDNYYLDDENSVKALEYRLNELYDENEQLKKENNNLKKALWEAEENYLHEAYYDNPIREEDKLIDLKEDFKRGYWND